MTNFGTNIFNLPTEKCTDIIICWPNDAEGDVFNTFVQDLSAIAGCLGEVQKICDAVVGIAKDGMEIAAMFP